MLPVYEAIILAKQTGFWSYSSHKTAEEIVIDLGRDVFGCDGGGAATAL